jgi:glycosyltransferase involved in cell wall biosynthesis
VVRIISRLNVGGPAIQAITLSKQLEPLGYSTILIRGREDPDEGNMDYLAERLGIRPVFLPSLRRHLGLQDVLALGSLIRLLRRARPEIIHTHAAKAGALGRTAALLAFGRRRRPILVHTFHGHSLTGYFSKRENALFRAIERFLAPRTDRLIAVSTEVRDELVGLEVAPPERFEVVPLGLDLSPFLVADAVRAERGAALRAEFGIPEEARLVTLVARLVPIKRVDRFLRVAGLLRDDPDVAFLIVGDGIDREQLQSSPEAQELDSWLHWAGLRRDMAAVYFASDVVVQTSDNEGTPVALIEAQAAGVPVVTTAVGGVSSAVVDGGTGRITALGDDVAMAEAIRPYLEAYTLRTAHGARGRRHAEQSFSLDRLVHRVDDLYRRLLGRAG